MTAMNLFMEPFVQWSRLALKAGETAMSSAQVIGRRSGHFLQPGAGSQVEFLLMGREKAEAALESAQAVGVRMMVLNQQLLSFALKQAMSASAAWLSIAASRSPAESADRQAKLVRDTIAGSAVAVSKISGSAARVGRSALKPVQKRVAGNVRRLGKR